MIPLLDFSVVLRPRNLDNTLKKQRLLRIASVLVVGFLISFILNFVFGTGYVDDILIHSPYWYLLSIIIAKLRSSISQD